MKTVAKLTFAIFMAASPANHSQAADSWDFAASYKSKCDGNTREMSTCLEGEFQKVDAQLNSLYMRLVGLLENPESLRESQRAWIPFRDLTCQFETSGLQGGSLSGLTYTSCLIDVTAKRIRDMNRYLSWDCNGCPLR